MAGGGIPTGWQRDLPENYSETTCRMCIVYRVENARLARENVAVHQRLLNIQEELLEKDAELKKTKDEWAKESQNVEFLRNQYYRRLKELEKESNDKAKKVAGLAATARAPSGGRLLSSTRLSATGGAAIAAQTIPDEEVIRVVRFADERIHSLESENSRLGAELRSLRHDMGVANEKLRLREAELHRLAGLLKGGIPPDVLANTSNAQSSSASSAPLDDENSRREEMEFLRLENNHLKRRLEELTSGKIDGPPQKKGIPGKKGVESETNKENGGQQPPLGTISYQRLKRLEDENSNLKKRIQELQDANKKAAAVVNSNGKSGPAGSMQDVEYLRRLLAATQSERNKLRLEIQNLREATERLERAPPSSQESLASDESFMNEEIKIIQADRDLYKRKYLQLLQQKPETPQQSRERLETELTTAMQQKNALVSLLQDRINILSSEKEHYWKLYKESIDRLNSVLARDAGMDRLLSQQATDGATDASNRNGPAQNGLRELLAKAQQERDDALDKVSSYWARIKQQEERISELEQQMFNISASQETSAVATHVQKIRELHERVRELSEELRSVKGQLLTLNESNLNHVDRDLRNGRSRVADMKKQISVLSEAVKKKDQELRRLRTDLAMAESARGRLDKDLDPGSDLPGPSSSSQADQNNRLRHQLATVTRQYQECENELRRAQQDYITLKRQTEEYAREVARVNDMLAQKDRECEELADELSRRTGSAMTSHASSSLTSQQQQTAGSTHPSTHQRPAGSSSHAPSGARGFDISAINPAGQLASKDAEIRRLTELVRSLENSVQQYTAQANQYVQRIQTLEAQLTEVRAELGRCEGRYREAENRLRREESSRKRKKRDEFDTVAASSSTRGDGVSDKRIADDVTRSGEGSGGAGRGKGSSSTAQTKVGFDDIIVEEQQRRIGESIRGESSCLEPSGKKSKDRRGHYDDNDDVIVDWDREKSKKDGGGTGGDVGSSARSEIGRRKDDSVSERTKEAEQRLKETRRLLEDKEKESRELRHQLEVLQQAREMAEQHVGDRVASLEARLAEHVDVNKLAQDIDVLRGHIRETANQRELQTQENAELRERLRQFEMEVDGLKRQVTFEQSERQKTRDELRRLELKTKAGFKGQLKVHALSGMLQTHVTMLPTTVSSPNVSSSASESPS